MTGGAGRLLDAERPHDVADVSAHGEWTTWEFCPRCGGMAALGWRGGDLVELDYVRECDLTAQEAAALREDIAGRR